MSIQPYRTTLPPTLESAHMLLQQVFGYDSFRPLQAEVVESVLQGRDTLAIMPTGSGKSLCYQLPALLREGMTVVVSPLISLMQDQVEQLQALDLPAVYLNSSLTFDEYGQTVAQVRQGAVKLLYVAPETLLLPGTLALLARSRVACLTIDEAHCISQWGHDFRPEYRQLLEVRRRLPEAVCVAVTATATPRVQTDIRQSLGVAEANVFVSSFDRPNLFLAVQERYDGVGQLLDCLASHRDQSGIIYCATRRQVDELTAQLTRAGWPVLPYHAGLDDATRRHNQRRFIQDDMQLMVATVAFGMGIDKPDVRFVVHYSLPKDLESYYQQIGRAGRDGLRADCLLLFNYADLGTIRFFIQQQAEAEQQGASLRLQALVGFAESDSCRRQPLLAYFGEEFGAAQCGGCDNCLAEDRELVDLTVPAQKFLSCVKRTGERFGIIHIVDVLRGSQSQKVVRLGHHQLSTHGIGLEFSRQEWSYLARQFIQKGLLNQDLTHGSLSLTAQAYAVFKGQQVLGRLQPGGGQGEGSPEEVPEHDPALFTELRATRRQLAEAVDVPSYVIFPDRTLLEMATTFPQSREALAQIYGMGQAKLERYAEPFLAVLRRYCQERGLEERPRVAVAPTVRRATGRPGERTLQVARAYNDGQPVAAVAASLGIKEQTVLDHLWRYVQAGNTLRAAGLTGLSSLAEPEQARVLALFAQQGAGQLRPVFDALDGQVSFEELKILRLQYVSERAE